MMRSSWTPLASSEASQTICGPMIAGSSNPALVYRPGMASRHPRLGVARDPEADRALKLTESLLDPGETRSAAAQIRALTLRGAQAVLAGAGSDSQLQAHLAVRYGARPGRGSLLDLDAPPGKPDPGGAAPASDALRWVRGEGAPPSRRST